MPPMVVSTKKASTAFSGVGFRFGVWDQARLRVCDQAVRFGIAGEASKRQHRAAWYAYECSLRLYSSTHTHTNTHTGLTGLCRSVVGRRVELSRTSGRAGPPGVHRLDRQDCLGLQLLHARPLQDPCGPALCCQ
eukprot:1685073-Rhodomonas_salina.1